MDIHKRMVIILINCMHIIFILIFCFKRKTKKTQTKKGERRTKTPIQKIKFPVISFSAFSIYITALGTRSFISRPARGDAQESAGARRQTPFRLKIRRSRGKISHESPQTRQKPETGHEKSLAPRIIYLRPRSHERRLHYRNVWSHFKVLPLKKSNNFLFSHFL